jgi:DNA-binding XRE family transcriptional regulator
LITAVATTITNLEEVFQPADGLDLSKSERRKLGKGAVSAASEFFQAQGKAENQERLDKLPPAILLPLLKALANEPGAVARIHNGTLSLEIDRRPDLDFLGKFRRVIYLDATLDPADLARLTPRHIKPIQTAPPDLGNLTVVQILTEGLGSNNLTDTAINRCQTLLKELPSAPVICPKSIKDTLGADGHWFKDSRNVNDFDGAPTLTFVGLPRPNVGQIQDQYLCLTGSLEGWEDYYQRRQQAEVIQGVLGRQRAARYPGTQFTCYVLTGPNDDLSYLQDYGAVLQTRSAFEICPAAGNPTQIARWRLLEALRQTADATQGALAKTLGISQQAVSKLLKSAGVTLAQLQAELENLTTAPIKGLYRAGCETNELLAAMAWFFDLPIADVVTEVLSAARKGDPFDWIRLFPEAAQARILGILYGILSSAEPDPPPL